jgi:hypothetical protein
MTPSKPFAIALPRSGRAQPALTRTARGHHTNASTLT